MPGALPPALAARAALAQRRLRDGTEALDGSRRSLAIAVGATTVVLIAVVIAVLGISVHTLRAHSAPVPTSYLMRPVVADGAALPAAAPQRAEAAAPPRMGSWTPEIGRQIAERALHWLSWPYSFAGGNAHGPTYGVAVDKDSRNDPSVRGFDCSGLVLYALAPWRTVAHLASSQYVQAGTWHPTLSTLLPGDLVFWSDDGTVAGVEHVAIYVGDGKVVQAPRSGSRITITPIGQVRTGRIGTVRPLT